MPMSNGKATNKHLEKLKGTKIETKLPVRRLSIAIEPEAGLVSIPGSKGRRAKIGSAVMHDDGMSSRRLVLAGHRGSVGSLQSRLSDRGSNHSMRQSKMRKFKSQILSVHKSSRYHVGDTPSAYSADSRGTSGGRLSRMSGRALSTQRLPLIDRGDLDARLAQER